MSNFSIESLRLVRPYEPSYRTAKSAVGAAKLLECASCFASLSEALSDCSLVVGTTAATGRAIEQELHLLPDVSARIRVHLQHARAALLFGSEKFGLSNDDLSHCDWLMRIPTLPTNYSMNLGQAVAVCLYELSRTPSDPPNLGTPIARLAQAGDKERLRHLLHELLSSSGYLEKHPIPTIDARLRRTISRMRLSTTDTEALLGMLRQALWKIRSNEN